ncbi:hypothetical protein DYB26_002514 [Aphanomyces astaci]|uniref:Uncharacterized protein n=1 Tax=Aphanomyces astaci TaxID=112090 RepID=A0A418CJ37_APHAT|nr:hypothetical protein DYB26_002514 [Aphanomyces astaci]
MTQVVLNRGPSPAMTQVVLNRGPSPAMTQVVLNRGHRVPTLGEPTRKGIEEVAVTEPPLVPVVGGTTDVLPAVEESKSEEVRNTMEELAKENKATGTVRAASMTWDESRRRYGEQTMGPNWEQLPRPPIEGAYVDEDYLPPEKSDAEKRAEEKAEARAKLRAERRNRPDSTPDSE